MGYIMRQSQHRRVLKQGGERNPHQYLRTDSSRVCTLNILQGQTRSSCPSILRPVHCLTLRRWGGGGGDQCLDLFSAAKSLWEFCLENNTTLTVDYLPEVLNKVSDWESRNQNSSSEWAIPENIHTSPMDNIGNPVRNAQ